MPTPPKELAKAIQRDVRRLQNFADAHPGYWKTRRDEILIDVEAEFSPNDGEANKLAIAGVALFAIIEETAAREEDVNNLIVLYHHIMNRAEGRPAEQAITLQMLNTLDQEITSLQVQGLPTSALNHARRRMEDKHRERFEGIIGRAGGAKPLNELFARVMYVVLYTQCKDITQRRRLDAEASQITGLLPSQLSNDRSNLPKRSGEDRSLHRLFLYARSEWLRRRSLVLSDYVSD